MGVRSAVGFRSFFQGGFESATHRRRDGRRLDVLAASRHDLHCEQDYALLQSVGINTVRDGLRWHQIEHIPGRYDWSSFLPMLHAACACRMEVIWDLCHWGVPDWLNPFSDDFAPRFADFAHAAATLIANVYREHTMGAPALCAINEISFWAWVGGDVEHFAPYGKAQGPLLKQQLVRASILALQAIRPCCPGIRLLQPEPLIHVAAPADRPEDGPVARGHHLAQFQAFDMLLGRSHPELGGREDLIDVLGVNFYWNNQWVHNGPHTPLGHPSHRALHTLMIELWDRYRKPIAITETGAECANGAGWLGYIMAEVRQAEAAGVPVLGVCLYPVLDYPGWDDDRHCAVGLLRSSRDWSRRTLDASLLAELRIQQTIREQNSFARAELPETQEPALC